MAIKLTTPAELLPTPRPSARLLLRVGQVVTGRVVGVEQQSITLEIAGQRVSAQAKDPLQVGQHLHFEVVRGGDSPLLKMLNEPGASTQAPARQEGSTPQPGPSVRQPGSALQPASPGTATRQEGLRIPEKLAARPPADPTIQTRALGNALPRQTGQASLPANLTRQNGPPLPERATQLTRHSVDQLPGRLQATTADGLKQATVARVFLGRHLATTAFPAQTTPRAGTPSSLPRAQLNPPPLADRFSQAQATATPSHKTLAKVVQAQLSQQVESAGQRVSAPAKEPLQPAVIRGGNPPLLRALTEPGASTQNLTLRTTLAQQEGLHAAQKLVARPPADPTMVGQTRALRNALPRQTGLAPLLANLGALAQHNGPRLPERVAQLTRHIVDQLPSQLQATTASGLKQALADSGTFLERRLATAVLSGGRPLPQLAAWIRRDFKANLLRLRQALPNPASPAQTTAKPPPSLPPAQPSPPPPLPGQPLQAQPTATPSLTPETPPEAAQAQLSRQVDGALARVQLHQQASLPTQDGPQPLVMELPVYQQDRTDLWHVRLAQEEARPTTWQRPGWSASLAFDLEGLGPVQAQVTVHGDQVAVTFWSEQQATTTLFEQHVAELRTDLKAAGLTPGRMNCRLGHPPATATPLAPAVLDERA